MPNKRKKGKKMIGAYVPDTIARQFRAICETRRCSVSDMLVTLMRQEIANPEQPKQEGEDERK